MPQLVAAAIDTIAEVGFGQASIARIAKRAGIGKGVITYHCADKDDLVRAVIDEVIDRAAACMEPRIDATSLEASLKALEAMLQLYQETCEFRAFDARAMALTIRAAIDIVPQRLVQDPTFDIDRYGAEIAETFVQDTRAERADHRAKETAQ